MELLQSGKSSAPLSSSCACGRGPRDACLLRIDFRYLLRLRLRRSTPRGCLSPMLTLFLSCGHSGRRLASFPSGPRQVAGCLSRGWRHRTEDAAGSHPPALTAALSAFSPQGVWLPCPLYGRLQHEPLGEAETAGPVVERAGHPPPLRSAEGIFCLCVRDMRAN